MKRDIPLRQRVALKKWYVFVPRALFIRNQPSTTAPAAGGEAFNLTEANRSLLKVNMLATAIYVISEMDSSSPMRYITPNPDASSYCRPGRLHGNKWVSEHNHQVVTGSPTEISI